MRRRLQTGQRAQGQRSAAAGIPLLWPPAIFCGVAWEKTEGAAPWQKPLLEKEGALPPPGFEHRAQPQPLSSPRQREAGKQGATGDGVLSGKRGWEAEGGRLLMADRRLRVKEGRPPPPPPGRRWPLLLRATGRAPAVCLPAE